MYYNKTTNYTTDYTIGLYNSTMNAIRQPAAHRTTLRLWPYRPGHYLATIPSLSPYLPGLSSFLWIFLWLVLQLLTTIRDRGFSCRELLVVQWE